MIKTAASRKTDERGSLLVATLIAGMFMLGLGIVLANVASSQLVRTNRNISHLNALQVAEAGIEKSISQLNIDDAFTGFEEEELFNSQEQGVGVFTTEVVDGAEDEKFITSTGAVYRYQDANGEPISERRIRVTAVGTGSDGFSVHTGPGGLLLSGSANIANSDVFVNGFIDMQGAARIGTHNDPVEVNVANIQCPTGSNPGDNYAELCTSGEQPIFTAWSTRIYGSVCATGQQALSGPNPGGNIFGGDGGQGLMLGCEAPAVSPPSYDRQEHIDNVQVTGTGNSNLYTCQSWPFDRTWPADLQLNGDVNVGGSCNITVEGDVYITGDFTIGGASTIRVSDDLGEDRPTVIVDGEINVGGSGQIVPNSDGTGIHFISFQSEAGCGADCETLSGDDLWQSQRERTVDVGGAVNLPGMIFQSYWGTARIAGSGNVGAVIGQTVDMRGAGTVVFGTELASGEKTWRATSYQELSTAQ